MRPTLHIHVDASGCPTVQVPTEWLWELVEYLSFHRLNVSYHFEKNCFEVKFHCSPPSSAQRLLDHWADAVEEFEPSREMEHAVA